MTRAPMALLGIYLAVLLTLTFLPLDGIDPSVPVDLRMQAFRTINFALRKGLGSHEFLVLVGNLLAFVPLGVLLPVVTGRRSLAVVFVAALGLALAIEIGQFAVSAAIGFAYRTADIDDVIVNVTGALLGYALLVIAGALRTQPSSRRSRPPASR